MKLWRGSTKERESQGDSEQLLDEEEVEEFAWEQQKEKSVQAWIAPPGLHATFAQCCWQCALSSLHAPL